MKNEYAFPSAPETGLGSQGMTMRDVFAAFAPEPLEWWLDLKMRSDHERMLADPNRRYQEKGEVHWRVVWTWQWADAMLAEREKGADNDRDHRP